MFSWNGLPIFGWLKINNKKGPTCTSVYFGLGRFDKVRYVKKFENCFRKVKKVLSKPGKAR